jgi:sialidase-1
MGAAGASILRFSPAAGQRGLLFSNPAAKTRTSESVKYSVDNGATWRAELMLHPGPSAYSCLVDLGGGRAGCLYENGDKSAYERI